MEKKMIQVYAPTKREVENIKKELNFKNESQVITYLVAIREIYKDKITLVQHQEALKMVEKKLNQQTL